METEREFPEYKVVFVGDPSVGKSSIILRYTQGIFNFGSDPTIGTVNFTKTVTLKDKTVKLNIWDTAGQERYRSLIPMYSRNAAAAVIVFDLSEATSFESLESWINSTYSNTPDDTYIVIAANKADMDHTISIESIIEFVAKHDNIPYMLTSAQSGENITNLFENIAFHVSRTNKIQDDVIPLAKEKTQKSCC